MQAIKHEHLRSTSLRPLRHFKTANISKQGQVRLAGHCQASQAGIRNRREASQAGHLCLTLETSQDTGSKQGRGHLRHRGATFRRRHGLHGVSRPVSRRGATGLKAV
jgi:hypothetical protein